MLRRSKTKSVRLQSGPVPNPGGSRLRMQLVSLRLLLPTTLVSGTRMQTTIHSLYERRRIKTQRLSRLDERRGCTPVWWSSICGQAKPWSLPGWMSERCSRSRREALKAGTRSSGCGACRIRHRLMFWALVGDMSGFPSLPRRGGGVCVGW